MRSRPATRTAFARECSILPGSSREAMFLVRGTRSRRNALLLNACESAIRRESEANGRVSPKQDFAGRNAPGFRKRRNAFPKFPPAIHPRELPDPVSLCSFGSALRTSHACTLSTLRQASGRCNSELMSLCAEAVEDGNCLWKALEKPGKNRHCANRHRGTMHLTTEPGRGLLLN